MRIIIRAIPNALTCCNLMCGCGAIIAALNGAYIATFWLVMAAAVFDFMDGMAARLLRAFSPIGADLDSLADVVSFGVAPAMVAFQMMNSNSGENLPWLAYMGFALAAFAALRLAKFNVDTRQTEEFRGLPTPAMAMFFVSLSTFFIVGSDIMAYIMLGVIALFCGLMVCDMRMFSFKFKNFRLQDNALRYGFAIFAVATVILTGYLAPAIIVAAYIIVSALRAVVAPKIVK